MVHCDDLRCMQMQHIPTVVVCSRSPPTRSVVQRLRHWPESARFVGGHRRISLSSRGRHHSWLLFVERTEKSAPRRETNTHRGKGKPTPTHASTHEGTQQQTIYQITARRTCRRPRASPRDARGKARVKGTKRPWRVRRRFPAASRCFGLSSPSRAASGCRPVRRRARYGCACTRCGCFDRARVRVRETHQGPCADRFMGCVRCVVRRIVWNGTGNGGHWPLGLWPPRRKPATVRAGRGLTDRAGRASAQVRGSLYERSCAWQSG